MPSPHPGQWLLKMGNDDQHGYDKQLPQWLPKAPLGHSMMCQAQAGTQVPYRVSHVAALGSTLLREPIRGFCNTKDIASSTTSLLALK